MTRRKGKFSGLGAPHSALCTHSTCTRNELSATAGEHTVATLQQERVMNKLAANVGAGEGDDRGVQSPPRGSHLPETRVEWHYANKVKGRNAPNRNQAASTHNRQRECQDRGGHCGAQVQGFHGATWRDCREAVKFKGRHHVALLLDQRSNNWMAFRMAGSLSPAINRCHNRPSWHHWKAS